MACKFSDGRNFETDVRGVVSSRYSGILPGWGTKLLYLLQQKIDTLIIKKKLLNLSGRTLYTETVLKRYICLLTSSWNNDWIKYIFIYMLYLSLFHKVFLYFIVIVCKNIHNVLSCMLSCIYLFIYECDHFFG